MDWWSHGSPNSWYVYCCNPKCIQTHDSSYCRCFIFMIWHDWLTHSSIKLMTALIHELVESWLAQLMICVLLKLTIQLRLNLWTVDPWGGWINAQTCLLSCLVTWLTHDSAIMRSFTVTTKKILGSLHQLSKESVSQLYLVLLFPNYDYSDFNCGCSRYDKWLTL